MKVKVLRAVFLHVILSVVCSRAVFCAGCRLAGCIVGGLVELSKQNIARQWIYTIKSPNYLIIRIP